ELDPSAEVEDHLREGDMARQGAVVMSVRAAARTLLAGERVALNFLQRLSGIATLTRRAVESVAGTGARITHTRKTTPGLRALECYAVRVGGGVDNRASLADAVLWKDNHWQLLDEHDGTLADHLARARPGLPVIVEVESEAQLEAALAAGVTHLLIDNQPPQGFAAWVSRAKPGVTIQASGGITLANVRDYADAGADLIAIGALTHSAPAVAVRVDVMSTCSP
ncbi:MAG: carboxylating nicotinate-nucleotide diphosphorylase, partial [Gemmatimonadota bacterium]